MIDLKAPRSIVRTAAALALFAVPATSAQAQERPPRPDDVSAISVYTEVMPTSAGPRVAPRRGTPTASGQLGGSEAAPLSPAIRRELREVPEDEAKQLEQIATSRAHGAPAPRDLPARDRASLAGEEGAAFDTTLDVISQSDRAVAFLGGLVVATAVAGMLFLRQRRA